MCFRAKLGAGLLSGDYSKQTPPTDAGDEHKERVNIQNPVIRNDCMYSVNCAEVAWNYKSGTINHLHCFFNTKENIC